MCPFIIIKIVSIDLSNHMARFIHGEYITMGCMKETHEYIMFTILPTHTIVDMIYCMSAMK